MVENTLSRYIQDMLGRGYDINTIKPSLIKWGYNVSDIDAAISDIYGYNQQTTQVGVGLDYVNLRGLLFKPKSFFFYGSRP